VCSAGVLICCHDRLRFVGSGFLNMGNERARQVVYIAKLATNQGVSITDPGGSFVGYVKLVRTKSGKMRVGLEFPAGCKFRFDSQPPTLHNHHTEDVVPEDACN